MSRPLEVHSATESLPTYQGHNQNERVWKFHIMLQNTTLIFEITKIKNNNIFEIITNPHNAPQILSRYTSFEEAFKQVYSDLKSIHEITIHLPPLTPELIKQCKESQTFYIKDTGERPNYQD